MEVSVRSNSLKNALNKVLPIVEKKNSRPILSYLLISASNKQLQISATDLETSGKVFVDADVKKDGVLCVNAKNIFDAIKELPDDTIYLKVDDQKNILKVSYHDIHYSLLTFKGNDFPQLVFSCEQKEFKLEGKDILELINKTTYAISNDETRVNLNGILLQQTGKKIRAVATDGYRLAMVDIDFDHDEIEALVNGVIIPKKGIYELKKIAEDYLKENISIFINDSFMYINAKNNHLVSIRLITREYPKYQTAIPSKTMYKVILDRDIFINAVKRIKIMSNEKSYGIRVHLKSGEMTIIANNPDLGNALEKIPVDYSDKDIEIGFNAKYLIDTLASFEFGEIEFKFNNELSPVIIKSQMLPDYLSLVVPLKLW